MIFYPCTSKAAMQVYNLRKARAGFELLPS